MKSGSLDRLLLRNFTAFRELDLRFSPGVNILLGKNGTGKTHIMKVLYAACDVSRTRESFAEKLVRTFLPFQGRIGRLANRQQGSITTNVKVWREAAAAPLTVQFSNHTESAAAATSTGAKRWMKDPVHAAYIPVKEMLAHAPGFRSLYATREIHFEATYADIIDRAYLPVLKGPPDRSRQHLLKIIQDAIQGKVVTEREHFFLRNRQGKLEFSLLAEGMRKLALLWLLIQNGTLTKGSVLFWDEPETNLNPSVIGAVVDIILELQRLGVQVFLATHDYVVLKEFDIRRRADDKLLFHSFYHGSTAGSMECSSTDRYSGIHPNAILETFRDLYDRDLARSISPSTKKG